MGVSAFVAVSGGRSRRSRAQYWHPLGLGCGL